MCMRIVSAFTSAVAGAVLLACGSLAAQALPAAAVQAGPEGGGVTLVAEGCGISFHRALNGLCYRNEERIVVAPGPVVVEPPVVVLEPGRVCPLGTHLGPHRRECWPN
jgi:hypothetical protein